MNQQNNHMFTLGEAAMAYALCAEQILGSDSSFLEGNPETIPVFVSLLFQSLEISIKHAGIESRLFKMDEVRSKNTRQGHGVKELAAFAVARLDEDPFDPKELTALFVEGLYGDHFDPIVKAMTFSNKNGNGSDIIRKMICGKEFEKTRLFYYKRDLGYGEVSQGDFAILQPISDWVATLKQTAANLKSTINILSQWKASPSKSEHFTIWLSTEANSGHPQEAA